MAKSLAVAILGAKQLKSLDTETLLMVAERALGECTRRPSMSDPSLALAVKGAHFGTRAAQRILHGGY